MTWHSLRHLLRKKDPPPNHQFCSIQVQKPKSSQLRSYDCHADQKKNIVFIPVGPLINFLTFHQLCFRTESEIKLQNGTFYTKYISINHMLLTYTNLSSNETVNNFILHSIFPTTQSWIIKFSKFLRTPKLCLGLSRSTNPITAYIKQLAR